MISNDAIDQFYASQYHCQLVEIEESFHGMLAESDSIRDKALNNISDFLKIHSNL